MMVGWGKWLATVWGITYVISVTYLFTTYDTTFMKNMQQITTVFCRRNTNAPVGFGGLQAPVRVRGEIVLRPGF